VLVLYRGGTCRLTMAPSDSRALLSRSLSLCNRNRHRHQSTRSLALTRARPPLRTEIPKANNRSDGKKHLFPILYLTRRVSPSRRAVSLSACTRVRLARPGHARVLLVDRFYCRRKLMRSRGDTTDTGGAERLGVRSHVRLLVKSIPRGTRVRTHVALREESRESSVSQLARLQVGRRARELAELAPREIRHPSRNRSPQFLPR